MQNLLKPAADELQGEPVQAVSSEGLLASVSIIVPIGPGDDSWRELMPLLKALDANAELIFVATEPPPDDLEVFISEHAILCEVHWTLAAEGRAHQMNCGADLATREFLWFLHADSRMTAQALAALQASLHANAKAVHYFDLEFQSDGPSLTQSNGWGVYFRSHYLKLPFGDQGLCLPRETFHALGMYDETTLYGEDHLLVWAARQRRVPLTCVGATIQTSARKYQAEGWLRTTWLHFWRTWWQAFPQWLKLLRNRLRK